METTKVTDENYPTIKSLANQVGKLNTAIVKNKAFKSLRVYNELIKETSCLDIFDGILLKHRFEFYILGMQIDHCDKCGKPFVFFKRDQKRFSTCSHHQFKCDIRTVRCAARREGLEKFIDSLSDRTLRLSDSEYCCTLDELAHKQQNYAFIVTKQKYKDFYHDLIIRTEDILPLQTEDLMISRRIYIEHNCLKSEPLCSYCGKNKVVFINRIKGYNDSCNECSDEKSADTRGQNTKSVIDSVIDFSKYEIISYPRLVNMDPLIIRCKKCGTVSEIYVKNGKLKNIGKGGLCNGCEYKSNWEETDFHNFLKQVYEGKIIYREGSRKIIAPYELDNYLPDKKLAFEYDGLYWHNEEHNKGSEYHLMKTEMCEKLGIRLIHVFSSDWKNSHKIVESNVKGVLGIYETVIDASSCDVKTVTNTESKEFQENNHLLGKTNTSLSFGLYHNGILVSLMAFRRYRKQNKYEWELVRFCNKINYDIINAENVLLTCFETQINPQSIIVYVDRRWESTNKYLALGFKHVCNTRPAYWYFKHNSECLLNRMSFQKHKLKSALNNFDPSLTEYENMKANGYLRIFDCGNAVFAKEYGLVRG